MLFAAASARAADGAALVIDDGIEWATGNSLFLEVTINGVATGRLAHFDDRNGDLLVRASTLRQLGFALPQGIADPVRVAGLHGVKIDLDSEHQRIAILAPLDLLDLKTEQLNAPSQTPPPISASPGALLNYDVYATAGNQANSVAVSSELRLFNVGPGVFSSTALSRYEQAPGTGWDGDSVRLDSSWQWAFPDSMLRLSVGDALTQALAWTRSTRIGGISVGTDFSLQPYRTTFPLPAYFGEATLPSAVDLYIDGIKQYSGKVAPGPFQLTTIPTISGIGNAQIVVTDAFGRTTTINMPLYSTHQLLQAGLIDWSANLGFVRENYGVNSFDYANDPMASGSLRYGVNNHFTAEAHAEATNGLQEAGVGGVWLLGTVGGVISGAVAQSSYRGDSGSQFNLGYSWNNRLLSFSIDSTRTRGDYRDVASLYGLAPPTISDTALASIATGAGSFGVNYLRQQYRGQAGSRYAGAFWSNTMPGGLSLSLGVNQNLDQTHDRSIFASLAYTGSHHINYSASAQRGPDGGTSLALEADQPVSGDGGFGWRALARSGDKQSGGVAEADWIGERGQFALGANQLGDSRYAYADATGALIFMEGHFFAARHVDDAFAVVSTDGVANVPVRLENRPIGATDDDGLLLVTRLNAYQKNQLAIDPMSLPANVQIDHVEAIVTPSDRAGAVARFGMHTIRAAQVILQDAFGKPLALGSTVRIDGQAEANGMVGFDGVVYLDTLQTHNALTLQTPQGRCHVRFDYVASTTGGIPEIGPLVCLMESR